MSEPGSSRRWPHWRRWALIVAVVVAGVAAILWGRRVLDDPRVVLLQIEDDASWIRFDRRFNSAPWRKPRTSAIFASRVSVPPSFGGAVLRVAALRRVKVVLDDHELFDSGPDLNRWKTVREIPLPAGLSPGMHVLRCLVSNRDGPSLVRVCCPVLGVHSDESWKASEDGIQWADAAPAQREWDVQLPPRFSSAARDVAGMLPIEIILLGLGCGVLRWINPSKDWGRRIRWILLVAWAVLAANDIFKVPLEFGYDVDAHMLYVRFVAGYLTLPRPDAGWQFFQAPLYYIWSGELDRLMLIAGVRQETAAHLLRIIPLLCGAAIIELSYRTARLVFPRRPASQVIATVIGGLLPVNIYMSQAVSNEPLAAVAVAAILLAAIRFLVVDGSIKSMKSTAVVGLLLGLALLTKVSALLCVVPLGVAVAVSLHSGNATRWQRLRAIATIGGVAMVVCGPSLIRNLILAGTPLQLSPAVAPTQWWQDPGYRTPWMFMEFGRALERPIYNGLNSAWDSLYATMWGNGILIGQPDWNYKLMSCGLWLALLPTLLIFTGMFRAVFKPGNEQPSVCLPLRLATLSVVCFIAAIVYVYLKLPAYSVAKASYLLGTAPCIGLLAAAGFDRLPTQPLRLPIGGMLICWAVTAYLTYFVF